MHFRGNESASNAITVRERTVQPKNGPTGPVILKICTSPIRSGTT